MDIRCPQCAEPWEIDALHDEAADRGEDFAVIRADFYRRGCEALFTAHAPVKASPAIAEVYQLLGDDVDGAAVLLEDLELEGLL